MEQNDREAAKRWRELSDRAYSRGIYTQTGFLSAAEQQRLLSLGLSPMPRLDGGYAYAERRIAVFGDPELCGWEMPSPAVCLEVLPLSEKFSTQKTHRDYLGALMKLGIKRELIGDIITVGAAAYIFCTETAAELIENELDRVGRDSVRVGRSAPPESLCSPALEEKTDTVASERLDCIICAVFKLSRTAAKELIEGERVSVNSLLCSSPSAVPLENSTVSVRGYGKFIYRGADGVTKKGRLRIRLGIFV